MMQTPLEHMEYLDEAGELPLNPEIYKRLLSRLTASPIKKCILFTRGSTRDLRNLKDKEGDLWLRQLR